MVESERIVAIYSGTLSRLQRPATNTVEITGAESSRREWHHHLVRYLVLIGAAVLGVAFAVGVLRNVLGQFGWHEVVLAHFPATVGLPCAALAALFVVLFLEIRSGHIEFEVWTAKFHGASGEVVLFVFVFLALALGIKMLW
jgi:hypothetical protein